MLKNTTNEKAVLIFILVISIVLSCKKGDTENIITLNKKWKTFSVKVLSIGPDACNYRTQPSDFYFPPINSTCQDDDIYDFTDKSKLRIDYGTKRCDTYQPSSELKDYKQTGDTLKIGEDIYNIILLSRDTLILDNCSRLNVYPSTPAKGGMKLISTN